MASFQGPLQFPLQEAFTVSVPTGLRGAGLAPARDRTVVLFLSQEPLLRTGATLLGL